MKNLKLEVKRIENTDVIATSNPLFNSVEVRSEVTWLFYNVDLSKKEDHDTSKHIYSIYGSPACQGVSDELYEKYKKIVEKENFPQDNSVYHYVNGQWVSCESYCGSTNIDHHSHQGF